jgi:hypothetical protein
MKKYLFIILIGLIPLIIILGYYRFFYQEKLTDENSHISKLIEKLPEYIELSNQNDGNVHIDFPTNTDNSILNINILTFKLHSGGEPAKIAYRLKYDKVLDSIISIRKEQ